MLTAGLRIVAQPTGGQIIADSARQQILAIQQDKETWTPAQGKLDSHFVHYLKSARGQLPATITSIPSHLRFETDGRVLVDIDAEVTSGLLGQIQQDGGTIVVSVPAFHSVRALLPINALESLAALTNVTFIQPAVEARTRTGSVESQGDITHGALIARPNFGVDGTGVKVGVLSDSVKNLSTSQSTGDLPANVTVLSGQSGTSISGNTGEGTAMLEIVHDLAPGAQLYFATAFASEASFAQNILALRSNGCQIIVDDVGYFDEPAFQDGIVAQSVNAVTADGALYFSSAGNGGNLDAGTAAVWEGDFLDGGAVGSPASSRPYRETGRVHNFGSANYDTVVGPTATYYVNLFWSDPWGASTNDYDLFTLKSGGTQVDDYSATRQTGTQNPYEICTAQANDEIIVVKHSGATRFLHLELLTDGYGTLSAATTGDLRGHNAATNAFAVAAVDVHTAFPNLFNSSDPNEYFSSDGPRKMFFQANGAPITPGNFTNSGGGIRLKPDITAADGVSNSVSGFNPFYGTSAAAPHAGAIAALLWAYNPSLTPAQIRFVLTNTAIDIDSSGWDRDSGFGIVMANAALQSLAIANQTPAITNPPVNTTIQCGSNASFTAAASGTPPLDFQWNLDGAAIPGATNTSLLLTNVHLPNHTVAVVVTNLYGSATSSATLFVQDTLPPAITLNGNNPFFVELGGMFIDPGATATDVCAGAVGVIASGAVNTNAVGTNTLTYTAGDGNGNTNSVARTVIVRDTTPPTILWSFTNLELAAVNGAAAMPNMTGTNYIRAFDLSLPLTIVQSPTNGAVLPPGTNLVILIVTDDWNNVAYSTNKVIVVTNATPLIAAAPVFTNGGVTLDLGGAPAFAYILEATTNLGAPLEWQPLATNIMDTNGIWQYTDFAATNLPNRFYRLELAP